MGLMTYSSKYTVELDPNTCEGCTCYGGKIGSVYFCNSQYYESKCDGNDCSEKVVLLADLLEE